MKTRWKMALASLMMLNSVFYTGNLALAEGSTDVIVTEPALQAVPIVTTSADAIVLTTDQAATDELAIPKKWVKAHADLKAMFDAGTALTEIEAKYKEMMQADIKGLRLEMDEKISATLSLANQGKLSAAQAKQAVDKGIQWFFYQSISDLLKLEVKGALDKGDQAAAKVAFQKAKLLYTDVLKATTKKRDDKFGTTMVDVIEKIALPGMEAAIASKDVQAYTVNRQFIDKTLLKMFGLAMLTYAEAIPTKAQTDQPAALTEGYFIFQPLAAYLRNDLPEHVAAIENVFASGDVKQVKFDAIQKQLAHIYALKVAEYYEEMYEVLAKKDFASAQIEAIEGNLFLVAGETVFANVLGKEVYVRATTLADQLYQALLAQKTDTALGHAKDVLKAIAAVKGMTVDLKKKTVVINGKSAKKIVDSYIDSKSKRSMVPLGLFSSSLGVKLGYNAKSKEVTLSKKNTTLTLKIGSSTVLKNGKLDQSKKLAQVVALKKGTIFVPQDSLAHLFDVAVFFQNGELVLIDKN